MGHVIAIAQQKGGAGKTMLAAQLAVTFAEHASVALLDIDPQGSLTIWGKLRASAPKAVQQLNMAAISGWRLANELEKLKTQHDVVLIDTPPVIDSDARRAIRASDLVLIPLNPAPPDLWAAEGTLKLAAEEIRAAANALKILLGYHQHE
jgi:chromosome partitioning protein